MKKALRDLIIGLVVTVVGGVILAIILETDFFPSDQGHETPPTMSITTYTPTSPNTYPRSAIIIPSSGTAPIRTGPSVLYEHVKYVSEGFEVSVTDDAIDEQNRIWYKVNWIENGTFKEGWIVGFIVHFR